MVSQVVSYFKRLPFIPAIKYTGLQLAKKWINRNVKLSFSEFGEDILIQSHFNYKENGFFVDVGCNHPVTNSITFALYLKGWSGVNVDGNKDLVNECLRIRKKDISVNALVSNEEKEVEYIRFSNDALNSINGDVIEEWNKSMVIAKEKRSTVTLTNLLKSYFPNGKKIDLLSIDVEEHDFEVLSSLDFQLFPPQLIVIEMKNFRMSEPHPIRNFLMEKNYEMIYYARLNGYFKIRGVNVG
jgi:hypothetical protein